MHGKDTTIPKGTEITAYVNGNMPLDPAKFMPVASNVTASSSASPQSSTTNAQLEITSNPAGAEISVDGNFVGDTPSELAVAAGVHTITISKHGYKPWERKLTVSSGKVTVAAELEQ
jgi:PEGA domain